MGRKPIDPIYKKITHGVSIDKWVLQYFKDNQLNLSEVTNKLLIQWIKDQNNPKGD